MVEKVREVATSALAGAVCTGPPPLLPRKFRRRLLSARANAAARDAGVVVESTIERIVRRAFRRRAVRVVNRLMGRASRRQPDVS